MRNVVIDLGNLDYIYSDTINVFISSNRQMLEVSGRIAILSEHPKVQDILRRAGLDNIMRIYKSEAEMIADSKEILRQTSSYRIEELQKIQGKPEVPPRPRTEFEDFRSEMGEHLSEKIEGEDQTETSPQVQLDPKGHPAPVSNGIPTQPPVPGYNQPEPAHFNEFDFPTQQLPVMGHSAREAENQSANRMDAPVPQSRRRMPSNERLASPSMRNQQYYPRVGGRTEEEGVDQPTLGQQWQQNQYTQPPPPPPPNYDAQATVQMPPIRDPEPAQPYPGQEQDELQGLRGEMESALEAPVEEAPPQSFQPRNEQRSPSAMDRDNRSSGLVVMDAPRSGHANLDTQRAGHLVEESSGVSKGLLFILLLVILAAGGGYYWWAYVRPVQSEEPVAASPTVMPAPQTVVPAPEPLAPEGSEAEGAASGAVVPEEPAPAPNVAINRPAPRPTPSPRPRPAPEPSRTTPSRPAPSPVKPEGTVRIESDPSGAEVLVNFARKGTTPIVLELLGEQNRLLVKKDGYEKHEEVLLRSNAPEKLSITLKPEGGGAPSAPAPAASVPAEPDAKQVRIVSNPPGAEVLLNYARKGTTPMTISLINNTNRILVKMDGYENYEATLLKSSADDELVVALKKEGGAAPPPPPPAPAPEAPKAAVQPPPAAPPVAPKPAETDVSPGTGPPGNIFLSSSPARADIVIDGKPTGKKTPTKLDIPSGKHKIEMKKDGLTSVVVHEINPGKNKALHLTLQ